MKKYTFRQVGLVGAGLFVLGDVLTIFVVKTYQLVFTFGLIRGRYVLDVYFTISLLMLKKQSFIQGKGFQVTFWSHKKLSFESRYLL